MTDTSYDRAEQNRFDAVRTLSPQELIQQANLRRVLGTNPAELDRRTGVSYDDRATAPTFSDPAVPGILNPFVSQSGQTVLRAPRQATNAWMGPGGLGGNASTNDLLAYIRNNYGYMAGFLDIPEVRNILLQAAREGWGPGELYGAISKTGWWRSTSASARKWQQLVSEDPAEAQRMVQEYSARISDAARTYGLQLSAGQIAGLATDSARFGWTPEEETDRILTNINWSTLGGGELTALRDRAKAIAGEFLVKVSDDTAQNYAVRIARGELTEEGVASIMQSQAKARFGYLASQIDAGVTPAAFFMPARDMIAATLEMAPDSIDLMDSRWLSMVEKRDDKGQLVPATLNDVMLGARRQPEWADTKNATDMMAQFSTRLAEAFGRG